MKKDRGAGLCAEATFGKAALGDRRRVARPLSRVDWATLLRRTFD